MSTAKVYLVDIETSPNLGYTWGKYEQSVIRYKKEWELLCFAYKEPDKKVKCVSRRDFRDSTDASLTKAAWKLFNEADVLIGHNIDRFDNRKLKAKFVEHRLGPPQPYKTIDTLKIARSQFAFNSNSLNDLASTLGLGRKLQTGGIDLWFACMAGDDKAWAKMIAYCKHDVVLLERVYNELKAWHTAHPNMSLLSDLDGCPVCTSSNVQRRGYQLLRQRKAARFVCQGCGHWFSRQLKECQ